MFDQIKKPKNHFLFLQKFIIIKTNLTNSLFKRIFCNQILFQDSTMVFLTINSKNNFYFYFKFDYLLKFAFILLFPFSTIFPNARANAVHDKRLYTIDRAEYDSENKLKLKCNMFGHFSLPGFAEHFLLPEDFDLASRTPSQFFIINSTKLQK